MAFIIFLKRAIAIILFVLLFQFCCSAQLPACKDSFPASLLFNNSFEQYSGCSTAWNDLEGGRIDNPPDFGGITVNGWHPFSQNREIPYYNYNCRSNRPTSIFNTAFPDIPGHLAVPLPLPDSLGFITIIQRNNTAITSEKQALKTYITSCLSTPLYPAQPYIFSFYFGFGKTGSTSTIRLKASPSPFRIAIFGRQDCPVYPLRDGRDSVDGCLTNRAGWIQLATAELKGGYGWIQGVMEFTPNVNISSIGVGPDCSLNANIGDTSAFYFMDKFVLAPKTGFSFKTITAASGNACTGNFVLKAPDYPNAAYQWYKDGIILANATSNVYAVPNAPAAAGNYTVNIGLPYNTCINTLPYAVTFSDIDKFTLGNDTTACAPAEITLNASWKNAEKYLWQNGSTNEYIKVNNSGTYWVQITDKSDCIKKDSVKVTIQGCDECKIYIPSAFTPNNDGINDVFKALPGCINIGLLNFTMRIYNRWGQLVFKSDDIRTGWDGTHKNQPLPQGVYIYSINYAYKQNQPMRQKGTIVLIK